MRAVIVSADRQKQEVDRLLNYIMDLDRTEVVRIPAVDVTDEYPERNNYALLQAAEMFDGEAFFWLEPDSVPIKVGWLKSIEQEYNNSCKQFMLSLDHNSPHDMIGGIGVYGPRTFSIMPKDVAVYGKIGWDTWLIKTIPHLIHRTHLIQHSYGIYSADGIADPHRFPRDSSMIRGDSVIFHRDKHQDLINYGI
jgi:hypothetical protein